MMKWLLKKYFQSTYWAIQQEGVDEYIKYILKKPNNVQTYTDIYGQVYTIEVRKVINEQTT